MSGKLVWVNELGQRVESKSSAAKPPRLLDALMPEAAKLPAASATKGQKRPSASSLPLIQLAAVAHVHLSALDLA